MEVRRRFDDGPGMDVVTHDSNMSGGGNTVHCYGFISCNAVHTGSTKSIRSEYVL